MNSPAMAQAPASNAHKTLWAWTVATFFGVGRIKPAPGTWGSIAAVLLWAACAWGLRPTAPLLLFSLIVGVVLAIAVGVPASTLVAREGCCPDPGFVVVDEVAGQWIALLGSRADWRQAVIALALFRVFDVTKPFPIRRIERLPGGWGIVFDDVAAGLYALGGSFLMRLFLRL
jgi:phosphatidylglycerophosphatase A